MTSEYIHQSTADKTKVSCEHSIYKARNRLLRNHGVIPELHYHNGVSEALEAAGLNNADELCSRITVSDMKNASRAFRKPVSEPNEINPIL